MQKQEKQFWLLFLLLNSLLFLPRYLFELDTSSFLPYQFYAEGSFVDSLKFLFYSRANYDVFRICIEISFLLFGFYVVRKWLNKTLFLIPFYLFYCFFFLYQIYHAAVSTIYKVEPVFFNDVQLLEHGLKIIFNKIGFFEILGVLLVVALFVGLFFLVKKTIQCLVELRFGKLSLGIVFFIIAMSCNALLNWVYDSNYAQHVFQFPLQIMRINARSSAEAKALQAQMATSEALKYKASKQYDLVERPNIYILFLESYGRILYDHPDLKNDFFEVAKQQGKLLKENGWYAATQLSEAPVTGLSSMVSYSSVLFGYNVESYGRYMGLLKNKNILEYEHLLRFFSRKGYTNYWISPIAGYKDFDVPWELYRNFYSVDRHIRFSELNYTGQLYGFGPAAPDQYTLNKVDEMLDESEKGPRCLFYVTLNSHTPFHAPDAVAEDWRSLSDGSMEGKEIPRSQFLDQPKFEDYLPSIKYQIEFVTQFITKKGMDNDIFILLGDHQPPFLTKDGDSFETPLHIISQDSSFIAGFEAYGLDEGLIDEFPEKNIRHEGIYSMFLREFIRNYGRDSTNLPVYLPKGITF